MIDSKELRIDNWVIEDNQLRQIQSLHRGDELKGVTPIPLTEEWHDRFKNNYTFELNGDGNIIIYIAAELNPFIIEAKLLEFVHQWQNLYFALTGEELILNEIKKDCSDCDYWNRGCGKNICQVCVNYNKKRISN